MTRLRIAVALTLVLAGCGDAETPERELPPAPRTMGVASPFFDEGETIPKRFTCDGQDVSPPLDFVRVPSRARELALVAEDRDADRFVHWTVLGIPPQTVEMPEGRVPRGAIETENGLGDRGWGGPCPPEGDEPHRYASRYTPWIRRSDSTRTRMPTRFARPSAARPSLAGRSPPASAASRRRRESATSSAR